MTLQYNLQEVYTCELDIVDIGNVALKLTSIDNKNYFFITKSVLGTTTIFKFGPLSSDTNEILDDMFACNISSIDFKANTLLSSLSKFANDPKKQILEISEITDYEAITAFPNMCDFYESLI